MDSDRQGYCEMLIDAYAVVGCTVLFGYLLSLLLL